MDGLSGEKLMVNQPDEMELKFNIRVFIAYAWTKRCTHLDLEVVVKMRFLLFCLSPSLPPPTTPCYVNPMCLAASITILPSPPGARLRC